MLILLGLMIPSNSTVTPFDSSLVDFLRRNVVSWVQSVGGWGPFGMSFSTGWGFPCLFFFF